MPDSQETAAPVGKRFVDNVLWSWAGVLFSLVSGLLLSPYVIHHLGDERYGIWALVFSLVDYFSLVDFGFRSAVVKFAAQYRATGEMARLQELVGTGLAYFTVAAVVVLGVSVVLTQNVTRFFRVLPRDESAFRFLIVTVATGVACGIVLSTCSAMLEAYQRFDITSRIVIVNNSIRVTGCFAVLYLGLGLKAMGICVLAGQLAGYALTYRAVRGLLPGTRLRPAFTAWRVARQMLGYGFHTFVSNMSLMVLNQNAPVMIGHYLSATMVGYYSFPLRLLYNPLDLVYRVGAVTTSKVAELIARGDKKAIARLAMLANRYCLALFLPLALFLGIFGHQLLRVWINPTFAAHSGPLLPVLGAGAVIAIAAQFNSTSILYGLAGHHVLARTLFSEAILSVAGLSYVVPRYGILGAASVVASLMIISRGILVPYLASRQLAVSFRKYLRGIYGAPLLIAGPLSAVIGLLNRAAGAPATWTAVLAGGTAMAAGFYTAFLLFGLEAEHRRAARGWVDARLPAVWKARLARAAGQS
jgi:O-antigen/teichoic acid export membrane protein